MKILMMVKRKKKFAQKFSGKDASGKFVDFLIIQLAIAFSDNAYCRNWFKY